MKNVKPRKNVNPKSIEALRKVHAAKRKHRENILAAALNRMADDSPARLKPGFRWTRTSLAKEAGVHINTLIQRDAQTGSFLYDSILKKLDSYASRRKKGKVDQVQKRIESLRDQLDEAVEQREQALKAIKTVEWELLKEKELRLSANRDREVLMEKLAALTGS